MSSSSITYRPRPDANAESEAVTLANVYSFILRCAEKKKGGPATAQDDPKGSKDDRATAKIP